MIYSSRATPADLGPPSGRHGKDFDVLRSLLPPSPLQAVPACSLTGGTANFGEEGGWGWIFCSGKLVRPFKKLAMKTRPQGGVLCVLCVGYTNLATPTHWCRALLGRLLLFFRSEVFRQREGRCEL